MNDGFERELRARLDRAVEEVEPRSSARSTALKRARRRRVVNAAVATAAAVSIAVVGFVGATNISDRDEGPPVQPAGTGKEIQLQPPDGETEIARGDGEMEVAQGETSAYSWVLSGRAEDDCLTLTAEAEDEAVTSTTCEVYDGPVDLEEVRVGPFVFAVGSTPADVSRAELEVDGEAGGVETKALSPLELFPAPADFKKDRQFFVAIVHREAPMAFVLVDPDDPAPMNAIIDVQPHKPSERCWVDEGSQTEAGKPVKSCVSSAEAVTSDQVPDSDEGTVLYPGATPGENNSGVTTAPARKG